MLPTVFPYVKNSILLKTVYFLDRNNYAYLAMSCSKNKYGPVELRASITSVLVGDGDYAWVILRIRPQKPKPHITTQRRIQDRRAPLFKIYLGFIFVNFDCITRIKFNYSYHTLFTIFISFSTLTKKHKVCVKGHQIKPQTPRILPRF